MLSTSARSTGSARQKSGIWNYRVLIMNFASRDLRARFKGTWLGFAWSLMLPLATLAIYSIVFGVILKQEAPVMGNGEDRPFPVFLFAGLVPWGMYAVTIGSAMASLVGSGALMKKIYFPPYAAVFGSVLATFYQSLIEIFILVVALLIFVNIGWTWIGLIAWFAIFALFVSSLALTFAVWNVYMRDTAHLVSLMLQLQFYLTPIIFPPSYIPGDWHGVPLRRLFSFQPMAAFVEVFRDLCYGLKFGRAGTWLTILGWTALSVLLCWRVYRKRGLDLSEEL